MNQDSSNGVSVASVVEAVDEVDPERVETVLDPVTDDGAVTRDAVDTAVSDTSKLLATAETRIELAGDAYDDAAAAAERVDDVPAVRTRLDALAERRKSVESRIPELRPDLSTPADIHRRPAAVYNLAALIQETVEAAEDAVQTAEDLSLDAEQFESWLAHPERRYDEFEEDIELVTDTADEVAAVIDELPEVPDDPAAEWAAATMQARVLFLLAEDLRAELADLRVLADRTDAPFRPELADRLDRAGERVIGVESALDACAEAAWRDRFGGDIAAFETAVDAFNPPVEWGTVERTLEDHQPDVSTGGQ